MPKPWIKEEMKRDALADWTGRAVLWVKAHRDASVMGAIGLGFILVVSFFYLQQRKSAREKIENDLGLTFRMLYSGNLDQAKGSAQDILNRSPKGVAALLAGAYKGEAEYALAKRKQTAGPSTGSVAGLQKEAQEHFLASIAIYEETVAKAGQNKELAPTLWLSLSGVYQEAGKFQEAAQSYRAFLANFPGHPFSGLAHLQLAFCLEKIGQPEAARASYLTASQSGNPAILEAAGARLALLGRPEAIRPAIALPGTTQPSRLPFE